jgi:histidinol dehydrogenase
MKIVEWRKGKEFHFRREDAGVNKRVEGFVRRVFDDIRKNGDPALLRYIRKYDGWNPRSAEEIYISKDDIKKRFRGIDKNLKVALDTAKRRIEKFHRGTVPKSFKIRERGIELIFRVVPLERVGIYVPGGKAFYPSTLLMNAIPARTAGVKEIFVATPSSPDSLNPAVLYSAIICDIDGVFLMGGAHAIGSFVFGTKTVPSVDKVTGPGNIYVAAAKREASKFVGIDMFAGPSEILVLADGSVPARFVAVDLLSQAEHDENAVPVLVTTSKSYAEEVTKILKELLENSPRKKIAMKSIYKRGMCFVVESIDDGIEIVNRFAPEHLSLAIEKPKSVLDKCRNAGTIFLGAYTPESIGDYVAGPNHTLPTGGMARFQSTLSSADFVKAMNVVSFNKKSLENLGKHAITIAECEGLFAHASAIKERLR